MGSGWDARYRPVSYNLTSRSGNETQFVSMLQRCRAAGVAVYVDAVFNQQAPYSGVGVAGSPYGHRAYPLFGPEDFHHLPNDTSTNCGVHDYNDKENIQQCDLLGMPDLCTGCPHVQETVAAYLNRMAELGIAGFRIDAAKHMDAGELRGLLDRVNGSLFRFQEVTAVPGEAVQTPMYYADGPVTEFGYAAVLGPKFKNDGQFRNDFATFGEGWGLVPSDNAVVFLDNHDSQRNNEAPLTFKDKDLYTLANVFMLAHPYGYPRLMSSYYFASALAGPPTTPVHGTDGQVKCGEGHGWVCEHRWTPIANMVMWRRMAGELPLTSFFSGGDTLSFCRGSAACVAINRAAGSWEAELHTSLPEGKYCDVILSDDAKDCAYVSVAKNGTVRLNVPAKSAVAIHVGAKRVQEQTEVEEDLQDSEPLD